MQRFLTSATLVLLLVATAAAFAITERLKLTKSALMNGTKVSKAFSPACGCARSHANVRIVLRRADAVSVSVVDLQGHRVATLAANASYRRGEAKFRWDGRRDDGEVASDGAYQVKVHLSRQHQTIVLPNRIQLDTKPPTIVEATASRDAFSPDGDRQADFVRIAYTLNKQARLLLYLGGRRILKTYRHPAKGAVTWKGVAHGRLLRPGHYTLEIGALDLAGNRTPPDERVRIHVRIRYIVLATRRLTVRAGKRFEIGVDTDAVRYRWQLGKLKGRNGGGVLRLRAPSRPGTYLLSVSERGHRDTARLVVKK